MTSFPKRLPGKDFQSPYEAITKLCIIHLQITNKKSAVEIGSDRRIEYPPYLFRLRTALGSPVR